jgi:hypothetical protein
MRRTAYMCALKAMLCLFILGSLLLLAGCGGTSSPGNQQQPGNNGYSIGTLISNELHGLSGR